MKHGAYAEACRAGCWPCCWLGSVEGVPGSVSCRARLLTRQNAQVKEGRLMLGSLPAMQPVYVKYSKLPCRLRELGI